VESIRNVSGNSSAKVSGDGLACGCHLLKLLAIVGLDALGKRGVVEFACSSLTVGDDVLDEGFEGGALGYVRTVFGDDEKGKSRDGVSVGRGCGRIDDRGARVLRELIGEGSDGGGGAGGVRQDIFTSKIFYRSYGELVLLSEGEFDITDCAG
jgi:hypothetical protein